MSTDARHVAITDQLDAAIRDAQSMLADFFTLLGRRHVVDHVSPGPFARELLRGLDERMKRHRQRRCSHLNRGPGVAWMFGWAPERLHCERCAHKLMARLSDTTEDSTCDICRQEADPVNPVMGASGPLIVLFGACDRCYDVEAGVAA